MVHVLDIFLKIGGVVTEKQSVLLLLENQSTKLLLIWNLAKSSSKSLDVELSFHAVLV